MAEHLTFKCFTKGHSVDSEPILLKVKFIDCNSGTITCENINSIGDDLQFDLRDIISIGVEEDIPIFMIKDRNNNDDRK